MGRALLEHTDITIICHDEGSCLGDVCTLHKRSDHIMRSFPQHWRSDRGIMERTCPHGTGHPDPDSPWASNSYEWVHGCCHMACCMDPKPNWVAGTS